MKTVNTQRICFLIFSILIMPAVSASKLTLNIFTDTKHPVTVHRLAGVTVHYYNLDQLSLLMNRMNQNIKNRNRARAMSLSRTLFAVQQPLFHHAWQGLEEAKQWGITQYPAIVFGQGKWVIVGATSSEQAISIMRQWKQGIS